MSDVLVGYQQVRAGRNDIRHCVSTMWSPFLPTGSCQDLAELLKRKECREPDVANLLWVSSWSTTAGVIGRDPSINAKNRNEIGVKVVVLILDRLGLQWSLVVYSTMTEVRSLVDLYIASNGP